jgi:hypothetical protein
VKEKVYETRTEVVARLRVRMSMSEEDDELEEEYDDDFDEGWEEDFDEEDNE